LAWTAKTTGEPPSGDFSAQQSAAAELMDESAELADLAEHWPTVKGLFDFDRAISMNSGLRPAVCGCSGIVSGGWSVQGF
jgi:hypothetical protein